MAAGLLPHEGVSLGGAPVRRGRKAGIVVVLFAGAGGSCTGLKAALGRSPDIAINHDELALRVHARNHPTTLHLVEDIWHSSPAQVTSGKPVDDLWLSPDCTHFSAAKGDVPKEKNIRSLAWVGVRWGREVRPKRIYLENVKEFEGWGPLYEVGSKLADGRVLEEGDPLVGRPIPERKGETFQQFVGQLRLLGYKVEWRVLDASHYGAPTSRKRLFMVARCDGEPIGWPEPTHGPGRLPLHTAAECIDWSLPCPSIFLSTEEGRALGVKRPLAEKTLWRVAEGVRRFVLENPRPFVVKVNHGGMTDRSESIDEPLSTVTASRRGHALVAPTMIQTGYGERPGQRPRYLNLHQPLGTVVATGQKHALVAAFLAKHFGDRGQRPGSALTEPISTITATDHHSLVASTLVKLRGECTGSGMDEPVPTITASGTHLAEVRAFLMTYYSNGSQWAAADKPMPTITALHRLGIVTVQGEQGPTRYQIVDIGMRMLEPHELLRAQFGQYADGYDLSDAATKRDKVRLIGNSVCPEVAEALVRANLGEGSTARRVA